jgi:hypothetical protein
VAAQTTATLVASAPGYTSGVATITVTPAAPPPTLTVAPTAATVTEGDTTPVNFTATLAGATGTVAWTLTGPGSISATSGTTTSYTAPTSVPSQTTATLTASAAGLTASAAITIAKKPTITVSGTVLGPNFIPAAFCAVAIKGHAVVDTDDAGKFTIPDVTPPYDIAAVNTTGKLAVVYEGLTIPDPYIAFVGLVPGTARISGAVSGLLLGSAAVVPPPGATNARVTFGSRNPAASAMVVAGPTANAAFLFDGTTQAISWYGPATTTGTLDALQCSLDANGFPSGGWLYGTKPNVGLAAGAGLPNQDLIMTSRASSSITGNVTVQGSSSVLAAKGLWIDFPSGGSIWTVFDTLPTTSISYSTPSLAASTATATLAAVAVQEVPGEGNNTSWTYRRGLTTSASDVAINLQEPPVLANPVANATGIDHNTEFRWSPFGNSVQGLIVWSTAGNPGYAIVTMKDRAKIPDLSTWGIDGMGLPPTTLYGWRVWAYGPWSSIDEAAGPTLYWPAGETMLWGTTFDRAMLTK